MENWINELEIHNFKSIKSLKLDCKRINVFVGRPNVGKSNILEAISLLGPNGKNERLGDGMIRYEKVSNLFYDQNTKNKVIVLADKIGAAVVKDPIDANNETRFTYLRAKENAIREFKTDMETGVAADVYMNFRNKFDTPQLDDTSSETKLDNTIGNVLQYRMDGSFSSSSVKQILSSSIKYYQFRPFGDNINSNSDSLLHPFGENLFQVVTSFRDFAQEIGGFFQDYGLELVLDIENEQFIVQKRVGQFAYKTPFSLVANTLQRIIFYLAAITSNSNSVLLFEEPETHSFPPYVTRLAKEIVDSEENQFFIATHSPYLLTTLMTSGRHENVAVFVTDLVDHQTKVRQLTLKEIREMLDFGVDIFYNLNWFEVDGKE